MPKVKISEFSSTPANNTDIDSINIAEGCAPSGINDAIRELMAQLKDFQVGSAGDPVTVGGVLTVQAGSASTPALTTAGDTNTGMFFPAADTIAFAEGGAEIARFDSSGNLGLGVTPSAWNSAYKAIQVGVSGGASYYGGSGFAGMAYNYSVNTSGQEIYTTTAASAQYVQASGQHQWYNAASGTAGNAITFTQAMTLDASGRLGIGATSPDSRFVLNSASGECAQQFQLAGTARAYVGVASGSGQLISTSAANDFCIRSGSNLLFSTNGDTERARITSSGIVFVGKQATSLNTAGIELNQSGEALLTVSSNPIIYCNRKDSDGTLIEFRQDGATEGTISVSGTTVSYNGGHLSRWSQLLNNQRDESILKGTVLSNLNEMCEWTDTEGNTLSNEQLNRMKLSDVEGDTNVAGVFVNWDNDDKDNPYDMNIAMTGDMIIRIAQGTTVQRGDLLMSAGDGTAKPQGDDIVRSKTIAKVTSNHVTCTYADGSYCVPCVLMAC